MKYFLIFFLFFQSSCAMLDNGEKELFKKKATLRMRIGSSHFQNKKYHSALKEYLTAYDLDPDNAVVLNNLGITYFALHRLPLGEKYLRLALEEYPKYTEARVNLSKLLIELGLYEEAIRELRICENDLTYPFTDLLNYQLGLAHYKLAKFKKSETYFELALKKNPQHCLANFYHGRSLFEMKHYTTASESLDNSIKLCDNFRLDGAHFYSALSHYRINNLEQSSARLQELLKLYPKTKYSQDAHQMLKLLK